MKFADLTPNLVVSDIDRSLAFDRDVLGFSIVTTVPEHYGMREFTMTDSDGYVVTFAQPNR